MEIIESNRKKYVSILEKVWDFYLRFIFSKDYVNFLKGNWKTPEDIFKKECEYFKQGMRSDTFVVFAESDYHNFNFLVEDKYENLDKAVLYTYNDNRFHLFNDFFAKIKKE